MSELTLKSAKSLFHTLGLSIQDLEAATDKIVRDIDALTQTGVSNPLLINHFYASLYLNFINLDICAAYRLFLMGITNYEQRFAVKQLYVILNEGYKRLYGFDNKNKDSNVRKPQKDSVWCTYISPYENCGIPEIEIACKQCLASLENFYDPVIFDPDSRSHGAHYNKDYQKTYIFLSKLDAEVVTNGTQNFFKFMTEYRKLISIITTHLYSK